MGLRELCAELAEELKALKALRKRIADMRAALREEQPSSVWMIVPTSPCYVVRKEVDGKLVERVYCAPGNGGTGGMARNRARSVDGLVSSAAV